MDAGEITIVASIWGGVLAILLTLFILMRQSNNEFRSEMLAEVREVRSEPRGLSARFGEHISECEREQARLEGANGILSEALKQQSHTHKAAADGFV